MNLRSWAKTVVVLVLAAGCSRKIPTPGVNSDLPPLHVVDASETLPGVVLGPQGREAMIGEFRITPETMGVDLSQFMGANAGLSSGVVFCAEPLEYLDDGTLVVQVGMTWWPPGVEPKLPSRSITEGLMRCLGYLEGKAWAKGTVYLRPAGLPRVDATVANIQQEGSETLVEALRHAFLFGIEAIFQARGLSWQAGTQDGLVVEAAQGVRRTVEAHVRTKGGSWEHSNKVIYSAAEDASSLQVMGGIQATTMVEGISYVLGKGEVGRLLPTAITRAGFRLATGVGRSMVTMSAAMRAQASPGLSCVLRTLSAPVPQALSGGPLSALTGGSNPQGAADGGVAAAPVTAVDAGPGPVVVPGVDLEAAQKCVLSEEEQSGPRRTFK